jgi:AraC family transcriptional regulator
MVVCHPAGELHAQYFNHTAVQLFRVEVNQARLEHVSQINLGLECCDFRGGQAVGLAGKLYQELCEPDALSYLAIEGLGLELIATIARQTRSRTETRQPPPWLRQAHELIKSRFLEQLTLGDIARIVGVHPVTLAREFRRHYDCTVGDMVRSERIGFACRELLTSEEPLASIAISAGFYDQSHFARTFKKLTGITPAEYRLSCRLH